MDFGQTDKLNMTDLSLHTPVFFSTIKAYKTFCNPGWENAVEVQGLVQVGFVSLCTYSPHVSSSFLPCEDNVLRTFDMQVFDMQYAFLLWSKKNVSSVSLFSLYF